MVVMKEGPAAGLAVVVVVAVVVDGDRCAAFVGFRPKGEDVVDDGRRETAVGGLGERLFGGEEGVALYWKWAWVV